MAIGDGGNNFNLKDFNKTKILLLSFLKQQKIVEILSLADKKIDLQKEE